MTTVLTALRKVWRWVVDNTWALWALGGALLGLLVRWAFRRPAEEAAAKLRAERARLEAERHQLQRDALVAEALRVGQERARLEAQADKVNAATQAEVARIQNMDVEELAKEWTRLRRSKEEIRP